MKKRTKWKVSLCSDRWFSFHEYFFWAFVRAENVFSKSWIYRRKSFIFFFLIFLDVKINLYRSFFLYERENNLLPFSTAFFQMRDINSQAPCSKPWTALGGGRSGWKFPFLLSIFKYFISESPQEKRAQVFCTIYFLSEFYSWLQAQDCLIRLVPFSFVLFLNVSFSRKEKIKLSYFVTLYQVSCTSAAIKRTTIIYVKPFFQLLIVKEGILKTLSTIWCFGWAFRYLCTTQSYTCQSI